MVGALVSLLVATLLLWYFQTGFTWVAVLYLVLLAFLWTFTLWTTRRRLIKRLGKAVQIRLMQADFTVASDGESHTFPWSRFKSTFTDEENLYLFLTKRAAFVVPKRSLSPEEQQFVITRMGTHATAV